MQEERYIIIKMVEEGKISAAEAIALMEALEAGHESLLDDEVSKQSETSARRSPTVDEKGGAPPMRVTSKEEKSEEGGFAKGGKSTDQGSVGGAKDEDEGRPDEAKEFSWSHFIPKDLGEQIRESVQTAMQNMPQLTEELKENWHVVKRDLKRSLAEVRDEVNKGVSIDIGGIKRVIYRGRPEYEMIEKIEGTWAEGIVEPRLQLMTQDGSIAIRGWDKAHYEITLRKQVRGMADREEAKRAAAQAIRVEKTEEEVEVIVHPRERISVSIEAYVPQDKIYTVNGLTRNGGIVVENMEATDMKAASTNGGLTINDVKARYFHVSTTNGGIVCERINAHTAKAVTTNGGIRWSGTAENTHLQTTNGKISLYPGSPAGSGRLTAHTANAAVVLQLPDDPDLGVRMTAVGAPVKTTDVPGVTWTVERGEASFPRRVRGESAGFSRAPRSLTLDLETSNGRVEIRCDRRGNV